MKKNDVYLYCKQSNICKKINRTQGIKRGTTYEFVQNIKIQRCEQVGGHNARGVWLAYGQRFMGIDQVSKGS